MYIVTGGAGFIGSNVVHMLNAVGEEDVLIVDEQERLRSTGNLVGAGFRDGLEKAEFRRRIEAGAFDADVTARAGLVLDDDRAVYQSPRLFGVKPHNRVCAAARGPRTDEVNILIGVLLRQCGRYARSRRTQCCPRQT